jgi:hypothetical protein
MITCTYSITCMLIAWFTLSVIRITRLHWLSHPVYHMYHWASCNESPCHDHKYSILLSFIEWVTLSNHDVMITRIVSLVLVDWVLSIILYVSLGFVHYVHLSNAGITGLHGLSHPAMITRTVLLGFMHFVTGHPVHSCTTGLHGLGHPVVITCPVSLGFMDWVTLSWSHF